MRKSEKSTSSIQAIIDKALEDHRLAFEEGLALFHSHELLLLGMAADTLRERHHPEGIVTFVVDRNINYTNICTSNCQFCAFHRGPCDLDAYVMTKEELFSKIEETLELGGTQILLQGGLHPFLPLSFYEVMLKSIKEHYRIHIHGFSPPEIHHFAQLNRLEAGEVLLRLKEAGLDSMPGGGAEILSDGLREKLSPNKCNTSVWLDIMRQAHDLGLKTTATMVIGLGENMEERIHHLVKIREVQDETGGFTAFILWTYQPHEGLPLPKLGGYEYLKALAISRLMLDNFENLQASWVTQGPKIAQLALKFGANDMGSTMLEENVVRAAGAQFLLSPEEIVHLIEDMGFRAFQRDTFYRLLKRVYDQGQPFWGRSALSLEEKDEDFPC